VKKSTWAICVVVWLAWSLMACRSAVKDFYDPLAKPGHCGGAAGSMAGTGGGATGGQPFSTTSGQASSAAGGNGTGGQGGECP
jgi:hypothetical protein